MSTISNYTYTVCISLIIITFLSVLVPNGSTKRIVKAVLSVFIMLSFIIPLKNTDFNIELLDFDAVFEKSEDTENEAIEKLVSDSISTTLNEAGYNNCGVSVNVDYTDNTVEIKSLRIITTDEYDAEEIKDYIYEKLGICAEVRYIGE